MVYKKKNKILIVGGFGQLGKFIIKKLQSSNKYEILVIDRKKNTNFKGIKKINLNLSALNKINLPKDIKYLIFLAGANGGPESLNEKFEYKFLINNFYNLVKFLDKMNTKNLKQIIFFSSEQVYGDNQINIKSKDFCEPKPKNYYGLSKLLAEKYLYTFYKKKNSKIKIDILRLPRVIDLSKKNLIFKLMFNLKKNKKIYVTNLKEKFHFIYIDDLLNILINLLNKKDNKFKILDIGSKDRKSFSIFDLINIISKVCKAKYRLITKNYGHTHNPENLKLNYKYSYNTLRVKPKITVKDIIKLIKAKHGF